MCGGKIEMDVSLWVCEFPVFSQRQTFKGASTIAFKKISVSKSWSIKAEFDVFAVEILKVLDKGMFLMCVKHLPLSLCRVQYSSSPPQFGNFTNKTLISTIYSTLKLVNGKQLCVTLRAICTEIYLNYSLCRCNEKRHNTSVVKSVFSPSSHWVFLWNQSQVWIIITRPLCSLQLRKSFLSLGKKRCLSVNCSSFICTCNSLINEHHPQAWNDFTSWFSQLICRRRDFVIFVKIETISNTLMRRSMDLREDLGMSCPLISIYLLRAWCWILWDSFLHQYSDLANLGPHISFQMWQITCDIFNRRSPQDALSIHCVLGLLLKVVNPSHIFPTVRARSLRNLKSIHANLIHWVAGIMQLSWKWYWTFQHFLCNCSTENLSINIHHVIVSLRLEYVSTEYHCQWSLCDQIHGNSTVCVVCTKTIDTVGVILPSYRFSSWNYLGSFCPPDILAHSTTWMMK